MKNFSYFIIDKPKKNISKLQKKNYNSPIFKDIKIGNNKIFSLRKFYQIRSLNAEHIKRYKLYLKNEEVKENNNKCYSSNNDYKNRYYSNSIRNHSNDLSDYISGYSRRHLVTL